MSTIRKSIATASVAVLALGVSFAATTTPAAAVVEDGAGPLSWTYDVATGTYEHKAKQVMASKGPIFKAAPVIEYGAGPLSWTYDVATGTYENNHAKIKQAMASKNQVASNFPKLDSTSKLAYNNPEG